MIKILLVEDEGLVALYLKKLLIEHGIADILIARNGEEAVEKAEESLPDLLLMDIRLGKGMNGIEAVKKINSVRNIPVIYITASTDERTHTEALNTNPLAILSKPIEPEELKNKIDIFFERSRN